MNRPVLEVKNLSVDFRTERETLRVLKGVSCVLQEGKVHTLVGDSGSGKSVFAHALIQLLPGNARIAEGEVLYHHSHTTAQSEPARIESLTSYGAKSSSMREVRRKYMGMIFQEPASALSPVHTCGDTVATAIQLRWPDLSRGDVRARVEDVLRRVMIPDPKNTAKRYPFELSGGMRQRICIAAAIVGRPRILIADEPTTSLDVITQMEILVLLKKMKDEYGLTVLFITHDMGVAAQISDEILVMRNGELVEQSAAVELFEQPRHPHTQALVRSSIILEQRAANKEEYDIHRAAKSEPMIQVRRLSMSYPVQSGLRLRGDPSILRVVDDVSFDLFPGETLGVVGESGSGKTSLARCVVGLYRRFEGSIRFRRGEDIIELGQHSYRTGDPIYREIRIIFQDPFASLNPRLTVFSNIAEPLLIAGLGKREATELVADILEKVKLGADLMKRYPHAFSGGQRQRICIARAVITRPSVFVADEATAALDLSLRAQILDLLNELQATMHFSLLLITHDISALKYSADRVIVMRNGRIVESGLVSDVVHSPREAYTRRLMLAVPSANPRTRFFPEDLPGKPS